MSQERNKKIVLELFEAVEKQRPDRWADLVHPEVELHFPPQLPNGGIWRMSEGAQAARGRPTWPQTWAPVQPTEAERCMDTRVVAASDDAVVVGWRQRGLSAAGERFECDVLSQFEIKDGKILRALMFYFDPEAAARFLARARPQTQAEGTPAVPQHVS
jgi:ketosteroid isomerase-like protein